MKSIWSTPEFEAICRNLRYVDYLNFHKLYKDNNLVTSEPISEELYRDIRTAICKDMITQLSLKGFE